jgi:hypothetical protein
MGKHNSNKTQSSGVDINSFYTRRNCMDVLRNKRRACAVCEDSTQIKLKRSFCCARHLSIQFESYFVSTCLQKFPSKLLILPDDHQKPGELPGEISYDEVMTSGFQLLYRNNILQRLKNIMPSFSSRNNKYFFFRVVFKDKKQRRIYEAHQCAEYIYVPSI